MLATIHKVDRDHTVERFCRRPRTTSTNARKLRRVLGSRSTKTFPIPKITDDYKHNMNSVDISDQLWSSYTTHE